LEGKKTFNNERFIILATQPLRINRACHGTAEPLLDIFEAVVLGAALILCCTLIVSEETLENTI